MDIIRGSEWRRWELHLHTPFTKKEDQYKGDTYEEKWDNFYRTIHDYVGDGSDPLKAICAIAITDYLSIDNYMIVREQNRLPDCVKLVLPNVELRIRPIAKDSPINIHCIFSPEIVDEINERFFAKLEFEYNSIKYAATRSQLISLGRAYRGKENLPDEEACHVALSQYVISLDTLSKVFKNDPKLRNNTIIVVSNKDADGASGTKNHSDYFVGDISQLDATRHSIYQLSDAIFSSSQSDIAYFLGEGVDSKDIVKHKCGSLMPCIHGCDAHTNGKIFEPDDSRYCWIKADPTFEGLKQILYEPKERVRISSSFPELKQSYYVIDRVEIVGNADFSPHPIYFNDKLTCIIGGKSTGKSLLLHNMALAIDALQVKEKEETAATNVKQIPNLKVYWSDGVCSDEKNKIRKIVYIPQTYLNRLSDEKEETTEIDSIIQEIVLQDKNAKQLFMEMNDRISTHKQVIAKTIVDFMQTLNERETVLDAKKEIGDKDGIKLEISKLSKQLEQLSNEYNVTEDKVKLYQTAAEKVRQLTTEIEDLIKDKDIIGAIESVLQKKDLSQKGVSRFADTLAAAIERIQVVADTQWLSERNQIEAQIDKQVVESQESISEYQKIVDSLKPLIEGNEQMGIASAAIVKEKEKLDKMSKLDAYLLEVQKKYDDQIAVLASAFETYKSFYIAYVDGVCKNFTTPTEDLKFNVKCVLRNEQLSEKILEIINKKTINRFKDADLCKITEDVLLDPVKMRLLIEAITANSSDTVQLRTGHTPESAMRDIFNDWYNVDYIVTMDGDSIEDMSPGKKALVLLRLLISLAESKCPILIDQPEDDLDNRSVFDELIQFIKAKKVDRQIITATHNANIVLGGDAELVIIANQQGKNSPNNKYRFEYRGGSIEDNSPITDADGNIKDGILNQKGIQTHICEILEGGECAFDLRKNKYRFIK